MTHPRQNRVMPTGEILADPARGLFMGNRGVLHDAAGHLGRARWRHRKWICCATAFRGRRREIMAPGRYTELFFLDEAVALAAGHRPCAECRRTAYRHWQACWETALGEGTKAEEMDRRLHRDRVAQPRQQRRFRAAFGDLPDGVFCLMDGAPQLVRARGVLAFSMRGYGPWRAVAPAVSVTVLTPRASVEVLRAGYRPVLHPTAGAGRAGSDG